MLLSALPWVTGFLIPCVAVWVPATTLHSWDSYNSCLPGPPLPSWSLTIQSLHGCRHFFCTSTLTWSLPCCLLYFLPDHQLDSGAAVPCTDWSKQSVQLTQY